MKLRATIFLSSILSSIGLLPVVAGGSASNVTVSSQDLAAPGTPAQVLSVQAGPFNPPHSFTLPAAISVTDPTTFTLSAVWPLNSSTVTLGQVTVGVYGQVVGSVTITTQDRLTPGDLRIDQPYHIVFNTAGWTSTDSNPNTLFLPYLYLQLSDTSAQATALATTDTAAAGVSAFATTGSSPIYQIPLPTGPSASDTQIFSWPSPLAGSSGPASLGLTALTALTPSITPALDDYQGLYAVWPDTTHLGPAPANWYDATFAPSQPPPSPGTTPPLTPATLNGYTYWNPPNVATGVPVPATWNAYAVLENVNTSQYYATLVGSGNVSCFPLEVGSLYQGSSGTLAFPGGYTPPVATPLDKPTPPAHVGGPEVFATAVLNGTVSSFVTSGTGTLLPTTVTAKLTNMYPYSRFFVRLFLPADNTTGSAPTTTNPIILPFGTPPNPLPTPFPPYYSIDNGSNNNTTVSISGINLYNYVTQSGNYEMDLCEYNPVDAAVGSVYPQLASAAGANTITVPYGGTKTYTPGLKVVQQYFFYVKFSVNVNGVIVTQ